MHQLILDTNVLLAGLRSKRGASYQLIRWFYDGRFKLKLSVALALEYEDVLKRLGLLPCISPQQVEDFWTIYSAPLILNRPFRDFVAGGTCTSSP